MWILIVKICLLLFAAISLYTHEVFSFHRCYQRNVRRQGVTFTGVQVSITSSTKKSIFEDSQTDLFPDGPGHTRRAPISIADNSRIELAKIVVSTAILLLTLKIRFENLLDSYGLQKAKTEAIDQSLIVYSDGLRLEDLVMGTDEPSIGEKVVLTSKVFFSGLQIKAFNGGETVHHVIYGERDSVAKAFGQLNVLRNDRETMMEKEKDDSTIILGTAMDRILDGLKIGGRRRIFLPAELAFSSRGLAPYVPPESPVVVEVSLYAEKKPNFLPDSLIDAKPLRQ